MSNKVEKLTLLLLASENVDEAISALKKARKLQPSGKLKADQSPDWFRFEEERDKMYAERKIFEEERTSYQRRILIADEKRNAKSQSLGQTMLAFGGSLRKLAGYSVAASMLFGGVAYAMISYNDPQAESEPALRASLCDVLARLEVHQCAEKQGSVSLVQQRWSDG